MRAVLPCYTQHSANIQTGCPNIGLNSFGYESHCAASTGYYLVGCTKLQSSAHAEYEREHLAEKAAGAIDLKKCKITAHIASCASIMSHSLPSFFGQFLLDLLPRLIGAAAYYPFCLTVRKHGNMGLWLISFACTSGMCNNLHTRTSVFLHIKKDRGTLSRAAHERPQERHRRISQNRWDDHKGLDK